MKALIICTLTIISLSSCKPIKESKSLVDLTSALDKSTGFVDLSLSIVGQRETDSSYLYDAEGLYKKDTVGIWVSLRKGIKTATFSNEQTSDVFNKNGIAIQSMGRKSDKLLIAMAELYSIQAVNRSMRKDMVNLPFANLNQEDIQYTSGIYKFKAFMESDSSSSELYIDFDFDKKLILLSEKDISYREGILEFLEHK